MPQNTHRYDDIIDLPHHTSPTRPRMSLYNRAAQFAPFAALSGYEEAVAETARLTDPSTTLSPEECLELSARLNYLLAIHPDEEVKITHFVHDPYKSGGAYLTTVGKIHSVEPALNLLFLTNKTSIPLDSIRAIKGESLIDFDL